MSLGSVAPPRLPEPPLEYDKVYVNDLLRALEIFIQQVSNPGELRASDMSVTNLKEHKASVLSSALTVGATTISLKDASEFASSGTVEIQSGSPEYVEANGAKVEYATYTGKSGNDLTGVTRGVTVDKATVATKHDTGTTVFQITTSGTDLEFGEFFKEFGFLKVVS